MEQFKKFFLTAAGDVDDIAVLEKDLPAVAADELADVAEVDEMTIVDPKETIGQEEVLKVFEKAGDKQGRAVGKEELGVVGAGFDADDLADRDEFQSFIGGYGDLLFLGFGVADRILQDLEAFAGLAGAQGHEAGDRVLEIGDRHRLDEIVKCADANRIDRVLVVGGREDDLGVIVSQFLQQAEAAHLWHFDVEEENIGPVVADEEEAFFRLLGDGHDADGSAKLL